jgi:iron(III) transport system ATP-binding protein
LYRQPVDPWVAAFLGDADFLPGFGANGTVSTALGRFPTDLDGDLTVMIRPESVILDQDPQGSGVVLDREYFGHDQLVTVAIGDLVVRSRRGPWPVLDPGDRVTTRVDEVAVFATETSPMSARSELGVS